MPYFAGIDGGGTKTSVALVDENGQIAGVGARGPANARSLGIEAAAENIASAIRDALATPAASLNDLAGICACLSGLDTELDVTVPRLALERLGYRGPAILENDVVAAWAAATDGKPGIVVIGGTGSTALGMNARGDLWRTDGWDYLLGDAGSGYAIGRAGIQLAMKAFDGRHGPTLLVRELGACFNVADAEEMRRLADSGPFGKLQIASFAAHVSHAADAGDIAAREILAQAAGELAEQVTTIARRLEMEHEAVPVGTSGSVFASAPWVTEPFARAVRAVMPDAIIRGLIRPPEVAAALLGWQRLRTGDVGSWSLGGGHLRIRRSERVEEVGRLP
jgi:N-acetylglucosamine kinase-like BadF-type ATPase